MSYLHGIQIKEVSSGTRALRHVQSSIIGVVGTAPNAETDSFPLNKTAHVTQVSKISDLGEGGTLPDALTGIFAQGVASVVVVRVAPGSDDAGTLVNVIGAASASTGVYALLQARADPTTHPKILCAPGFTDTRTGSKANAAVAALLVVANRLAAIVVADAPASASDAKAWVADWGSDANGSRLYAVTPKVSIMGADGSPVSKPASPYVAGVISRVDAEMGYWHSPSNKIIHGIIGTSRDIDFSLSDSAAESNTLNAVGLSVIVRNDGFRLWGSRSVGSDAQWQYLAVRRTADTVYQAIEKSFLWALDKPCSANLLKDIAESVNAYLRSLKAQGAILGGRAWLDEDLNTSVSMAAGKLFVDFDIEPPAPLERIEFRAQRNADYYDEIAKN